MTRSGLGGGIGMFLLGVALALGFTLSAQTLSKALVKMRQDNTIKVKGYAEEQITSNFATWSCGITARQKNLTDAYAEVEKGRTAARKFLLDNGVKEAELDIQPVLTNVVYARDKEANETAQVEGYRLTQILHVETPDVRTVEKASRAVTELIKQGIEVESYRAAYVNAELETIKVRLLAKAAENAYERAGILAKNSKGRVGPLCSASQGVFQITPPHSTDVSGEGIHDTSTIEKTVRAVVTLEFTIEKDGN